MTAMTMQPVPTLRAPTSVIVLRGTWGMERTVKVSIYWCWTGSRNIQLLLVTARGYIVMNCVRMVVPSLAGKTLLCCVYVLSVARKCPLCGYIYLLLSNHRMWNTGQL